MSTLPSLRRSSRRTKPRVLAASTTPPSCPQATNAALQRTNSSGPITKVPMTTEVPAPYPPTRGRRPRQRQIAASLTTTAAVRQSTSSELALSTPCSRQTPGTPPYSNCTVRLPCSPASVVSEDSDQLLSKPVSPCLVESTPKRSIHALLSPDGITSTKRRCRRKPLFPTPSLPRHAVADSGPLCHYQPLVAFAHSELQAVLANRSTQRASSKAELLGTCRRTQPHGPLAHCHMQAVFELYGCAPSALYHTVCPLGSMPVTHPKRSGSSPR